MHLYPIDVEGLVRRNTLGARATDPQIQPRSPRRQRRLWLPRLHRPSVRVGTSANLSARGQIPPPRGG
jgi:hypothetical protein